MTHTLIFVYNAESGVIHRLMDLAHKTFSPSTYACNLCAVTYNFTGQKSAWRSFIRSLPYPVEFLHRDEFLSRFAAPAEEFPAAFHRTMAGLENWLSAPEINACRSLDDLMRLVRSKL